MRGSRRLVRPAAAVAAGALLIGACGGSDGGGGSAADWCSFAGEADVVGAVFDGLSDDPAQVRAGLEEVKKLSERLPDAAPAEIKEAATTVSEQTLELVAAFEAADYNILDVDLAFLDDPDLDARMTAASDELDAYTRRECGRAFGEGDTGSGDTGSGDTGSGDTAPDATDDGGFDPTAGTLREQIVTQLQSIGLTGDEANCIADSLDFSDPAVQSGDIASMLDVFGECGIGIDRLGELGGG